MVDIYIRTVSPEDAQELLSVYAPYVENTAISFEYEVPSVDEFRNRIEKTLQRYPYLVAVLNDEIVGYAYLGPFVGRAAYDRSAETTIYLKESVKRQGIGRKLYRALEEAAAEMGILNLYACIGYPEEEDEYLTMNSVEFHAHLGFRMVGKFYKCGYKFGRWYSMVWMEKLIGEHR